MFTVGFFSPKEQSGVTQLAWKVFEWLTDNTSLKVSYISFQSLSQEKLKTNVLDLFSELSFPKQLQTLKKYKATNDIVLFEGSGGINASILSLLPLMDRLFVLGTEHTNFTEALHHSLQIERLRLTKEPRANDFLSGTYILESEKSDIGFSPIEDKDGTSEELGKTIYHDYFTAFLHHHQHNHFQKYMKKLKVTAIDELPYVLASFGLPFEKCTLFEKYVILRGACGQTVSQSVDALFPLFVYETYDDLLKTFQNELYIAQINFSDQSDKDEEFIED